MKKRAPYQINAGNSFGTAALVFGVLSIIFLFFDGIILSVLGILFALKQWYISRNKWAYWALAISIIGLLAGLASVMDYAPFSGISQQPNSITP